MINAIRTTLSQTFMQLFVERTEQINETIVSYFQAFTTHLSVISGKELCDLWKNIMKEDDGHENVPIEKLCKKIYSDLRVRAQVGAYFGVQELLRVGVDGGLTQKAVDDALREAVLKGQVQITQLLMQEGKPSLKGIDRAFKVSYPYIPRYCELRLILLGRQVAEEPMQGAVAPASHSSIEQVLEWSTKLLVVAIPLAIYAYFHVIRN